MNQRSLNCIVSFFSLLFFYTSIKAEPIITFFIRQYPVKQLSAAEKIVKDLKIPGKTSYKALKHVLKHKNNGIFATYAGYLGLSNHIGQITFPRKQVKPSFHLLVAPRISPVFMIGNTIHHWQVNEGTNASFYSVDLQQDPQTQLSFWQVKQIPLPDDGAIPLNSIVIFAKPSELFIPEGITLTTKGPQLVLPPVYAKKELNIPLHALWVLTVRQFFKTLSPIRKQEASTYSAEQLPG